MTGEKRECPINYGHFDKNLLDTKKNYQIEAEEIIIDSFYIGFSRLELKKEIYNSVKYNSKYLFHSPIIFP